MIGYNARQTYQGRATKGRAGAFKDKEKVLLRYENKDVEDVRKLYSNINVITGQLGEIQLRVKQEAVEVYRKALEKYTPVDTGNLKGNWETYIDEDGDLHWRNGAKRGDGENPYYVYAQNYGKVGITPTGGEYALRGYYFLEKAAYETWQYIDRRIKEEIAKVKAEARQNGFNG